MDVERLLREELVPVFGLDSAEEIRPEASLVDDLGADSIDFVEIIYLIENKFGVSLDTNELFVGDLGMDLDDLFDEEGYLREEQAEKLNQALAKTVGGNGRFSAGISRRDVFAVITVRDLAKIIESKMRQQR